MSVFLILVSLLLPAGEAFAKTTYVKPGELATTLHAHCLSQSKNLPLGYSQCLKHYRKLHETTAQEQARKLSDEIGNSKKRGWLSKRQWSKSVSKSMSGLLEYIDWKCQVKAYLALEPISNISAADQKEICIFKSLLEYKLLLTYRNGYFSQHEADETQEFFVLLAKEKKLWAKTNKMCSLKSAKHRYKYQICLRKEYVRLDEQTQKLTDKMLGVVGRHRAFGRRKIIRLSNAILKSQSHWKKFIVWDCEWPGHLHGSKPIAASSMTECRIRRAFIRRRSLDLNLKILNTLIEQKSKKDQ